MSRNTRYFGGFGKGTQKGSSVVVFDHEGKIKAEFSKTPGIQSKVMIDGEIVYCPPNGQELDLDTEGPVFVENAQEKRDYLNKTGTRPAPEMRFSHSNPHNKGTGKLKHSFAEQFYKDHGMPLKEYMRSKYGEDADLTAEI